MFNFQQKRKLKVALESRVTWTILLILAGLMLMSAYDRYLIARDMADRRLEAEQEVAALESRKLELEAEVEYLSHDRGIEAEMRRQFDVAKAGEQVVIIVEDEATTTGVEEMSPLPPEERPWYRFW